MSILSDRARANLAACGAYDPDVIEAELEAGEYGKLCDYATNDALRPATLDEAVASAEASPDGVFQLDVRHEAELRERADGADSLSCYVAF